MRPAFAICMGLACCLALAALAQPAADAPAVEAARQREQAVRTVAVEFRIVEDIAEGGVSGDRAGGAPETVKVPAKAAKLESTNRLVIAGNKTRYESNHPLWGGTGEPRPLRSVNTFDGTRDKTFYPDGLSKPGQPEGVIGRGDWPSGVKSELLAPLTVCFRGLQGSISYYPLASFRPTGEVADIGGKQCREYASTGADSAALWFDASSDQALRRIRTDRQGKPWKQCDIEYRRDGSGVWVPTSWVENHFALDGRLLISRKVEVRSTDLNAENPASDFDVTFPPGARVYDARENKNYLVQDDGTRRELPPDAGQPAPDAAQRPAAKRPDRTLLWVAGAAILLLVGVVVAIRLRQKHA